MSKKAWALLFVLPVVSGCLDGDETSSLEQASLGDLPSPQTWVNRFVAEDGTARFIERHGDDTIDLYMDANYARECNGPGVVGSIDDALAAPPWEQSWDQDDPLYENGCGPVAGRNLLNWYGECVDWNQLATEMRTNRPLSGPEWWGACAAFCGGEILFCANACYGVLQAVASGTGSRSPDVRATMQAHTPPGHIFTFETGVGSLDRILRPLSDGHPVIALINSSNHMNHYVVVTGIFRDSNNVLHLLLANKWDMPWTTFRDRWSLVGFGDSFENSVRDAVIGDKPYTLMYYSVNGSPWDGAYITGSSCEAFAAATFPGTPPKYIYRSGPVCFYRDFASCRAGLSSTANGGCFDDSYSARAGSCPAGADCQLADVDGDGRDDLVTFSKRPQGGASEVWVSKASGTGFGAQVLWQSAFCFTGEICKLGDVNGDGRADAIAFNRGNLGDVFVAASDGARFKASQKWHDGFCYGDELCDVGDVDGDGRADVVAFKRSAGDVFVATSDGSRFNGTGLLWHDSFCYGDETCAVGDVNGDGRADVAAFKRSAGDVFVATSDGLRFNGYAVKWHDAFCFGDEICTLADVTGDGRADAISFDRSGDGDVHVARSSGTQLGARVRWNEAFCVEDQQCGVGDVNGDGRADIFSVGRDAADQVWVAAAIDD